MGVEFFDKVCTQISPLTQNITFHLLGDPLYLSNFPQYLSIAKKHNLPVEIVTSGLYLSRFSSSLLLSPPIRQISISLSALDELREEVRESVIERCLELIEAHQSLHSQTFINLRMHENRLNPTLTKELCERFGVSDELEQKGRVRLAYKVFLLTTKSFEWVRAKQEERSGEVEKKCYGLLSQVGILSNGIVVPCCIDCDGGIALGDLHTHTLEQILSSPRALAIKEGFSRGVAVEEQCKRCTYRAVE